MQKYRPYDDEEAKSEREGLLGTPSNYHFRDTVSSWANRAKLRRRISPGRFSCISLLSLVLAALLFALFGPSDELRSYFPTVRAPAPNCTSTVTSHTPAVTSHTSVPIIHTPAPVPEESCSCGTKPFGSALCKAYGELALERSRLFSGTGARVRKFLDTASKRPVKVGILGGSVSDCRGVDTDSLGKTCYARRIVDWMRERLYDGDEDGVVAVNGAIGGMDCSYYAFCATNHIPSDVDLVVVEFDVNDPVDMDYAIFFDQLLRITLQLPNEPAVLIVGVWGPTLAQQYGYFDPSVLRLPVAQYYDVPYISMKPWLYVHHLRYGHTVGETFWQPDYVHPNAAGHKVLGDLTVAYLEQQLCLFNRFGLLTETSVGGGKAEATLGHEAKGATGSFDIFKLPSSPELVHNRTEEGEKTDIAYSLLPDPRESLPTLKLETPYTIPPTIIAQPLSEVFSPKEPDAPLRALQPPKPFCADANDKTHPLAPSDFYGGSHGWTPHVARGDKHSWAADEVGARLVVGVKIGEGRVAIYYFRSRDYTPGVVDCWVDDNRRGAKRLYGRWEKGINVPSVTYIDSHVTPGTHSVSCEIVDETSNPNAEKPHHFRIVAIMAT